MMKCRIFLLLCLCGLSVACTGGGPAVLLQGDANSAEILYRDDLNAAADLAKQHCAQYERIPQLVAAGLGTAYYNCVRP
jgi:hypothetical protein